MTCFLQDILDICASPVAQCGWYKTASLSAKRSVMCSETLRNLRLKPKRGCLVLWLVRRNLEAKKCNFGRFVASQGHVSWFRLQSLAAGSRNSSIVLSQSALFAVCPFLEIIVASFSSRGDTAAVSVGVVRGCWRCRNTSTARRRYHHVHPPLSPQPPFFSCSYPFSLPFPFGMFSPMSAIL